MSIETQYDVIIIGTGAGGGTMARALAPTGKQILLLEKGGFIRREKQNWDGAEVWGNLRYTPDQTWYAHGKPFRPIHPHYNVGGTTKFYGGALLRLRERDFEEIEHVGGISPAWPISYADLEPYYATAEEWYYVHGQAGADPTEPIRKEPFPYPPLPHETRIQQLHDDLRGQGLNPFPLPMGMKLSEEFNYGADADLNLWPQFDGYPDPFEIKADSHICGVRPALQFENVSLKTHSDVQRLLTDSSGRKVTGVVVTGADGETVTYSANVVVVAAGAIGSPLLFFRSSNDKHPNGLANSSDLVGRNYLGHNNSTLVAISKTPNDSTFEKTLALADYYWGDEQFRYPMGLIQMLGRLDTAAISGMADDPLPGMTYEEMAKHSLDFWLQTEDLPDPNNRVRYNGSGQVEFHYHANNLESERQLRQRLQNLLDAIGCHEQLCEVNHYFGGHVDVPLGHQMGTMKMGTDPATSVLDSFCRTHDLDNLYVTDGSFMVSAGAVNPTLTIIAQTLRTADKIKELI
jgi:choline dehydrogenase-like flavoprotein